MLRTTKVGTRGWGWRLQATRPLCAIYARASARRTTPATSRDRRSHRASAHACITPPPQPKQRCVRENRPDTCDSEPESRSDQACLGSGIITTHSTLARQVLSLPRMPAWAYVLRVGAYKAELNAHREGLRVEASWFPGPSGWCQQQEARLDPLLVGRHGQAPCEGRPWALPACRSRPQVLRGRPEVLHRLPRASVSRCPRGHVAPPCVRLAASGASPLSRPCKIAAHE